MIIIYLISSALDWRIVFVGSPTDPAYDQELDCFDMDPVNHDSGHTQFPVVMEFTVEVGISIEEEIRKE